MRRNPPCWVIDLQERSKIWATAKTCFSPMQSKLLSKAPPATIERAAFSRQAVASTTTGGLPGPATIARFLLARAARATAGPPVTTSSRTGLVVKQGRSRLERRRIDDRDQVFDADGTLNRLVEPLHAQGGDLAPEGWALKTTVLPAASMLIALPARVGRLWVTGVIAPITPKGT